MFPRRLKILFERSLWAESFFTFIFFLFFLIEQIKTWEELILLSLNKTSAQTRYIVKRIADLFQQEVTFGSPYVPTECNK